MKIYEGVTEARFCVSYLGELLKVCKLAFSKADSSLYLFPYAPTGRYNFGRNSIPADQKSVSVPYDRQETSADTPKISIHESGQAHVKAGNLIAGPLLATPFSELRGEHIATASAVRFAGLAPLAGSPKTTGPRPDIVIPAEEEVESGRLVFYANSVDPSFVDPCGFTARLVRPTRKGPLFVGIRSLSQPVLSNKADARGIVVIAGWKTPNYSSEGAQADHLYVVGE